MSITTMFDKRRIGPIRQLSLQNDVSLRPSLKKQLSVEQLDVLEDKYNKLDKGRDRDRPKPIRVAWAENTVQLEISRRLPDPVEAKKCKEHKRPTTAKVRTQCSVEKESILYTRQELAERLRKAWKEREKSKPNLDIFLTRSLDLDCGEDDCCEEDFSAYDKGDVFKLDTTSPIEIFPKKLIKPKPESTEPTYVPTSTVSTENSRMNISVTIPSTHMLKVSQSSLEADAKPEEETEKAPKFEHVVPKMVRQNSINIDSEPKAATIQRPQTACSKRESFQKRSNTAFTTSLNGNKDFRPPLTRAQSVPLKPEPVKSKLATKRRLKSTSRRKERDDFSEDDINDDKNKIKDKKNVRCRSAPGGELVTMVSLVSPAGSDSEEVVEKKDNKKSGKSNGPVEIPQNASLRKTVKSVSFQQSSIHAVRSFSASFSFRRGSMAAALGMGTTPGRRNQSHDREKRAQFEAAPNDARATKRRLLRNVSNGSQDHSIESQTSIDKECDDLTPDEQVKENISNITDEESANKKEDSEENTETAETENDDPNMPKFTSVKEKECWIMYKKMSDKGLPVSFDTILRGMLTPTEYRLVRKEVTTTT